ncbi:DUF4349 domain-containing protein [Chitinophaga silvatica]|uniref:DUF4349 domain-containing protein n=1 Tax=Chitinophaga silvatica TaxID=2282649 RepID=A0A3E1Y353_9BACT|nr:DUF4349 domain-containing protein [Chitinophaga silvatica]RFS19108.1 DUF4349 domain-containing protein [Chitinophaga silvatica]
MNAKIYLIVGILTLTACQHSSSHTSAIAANHAIKMEEIHLPLDAEHETYKQAKAPAKLIRRATLHFTTDQYEKCKHQVLDSIKKFGGYTSDEKENRESYQWRNEVTFKVPSDNLEKSLDALSAIALTVEEKTINSNDVTSEYIDTEARMHAQQALESRYLELLKKAGKVNEMIEIEEKLSEVRGGIESMQSRLKQIDQEVSFSSLRVIYTQTFKNNQVQPGFISKLWDAVKDGWNSLVEFILWLTSGWPYIIVIGFLYIFVRRWRIKRKAKKATIGTN